jgi:hypothetical protein
MEKVKKFIVLPLGLFIMKLTPLSFYRDPWRYLSNFRLDFWQKLGYFFLNLLGSAAYIFLLALLFLIVFTKINAAELFKKPALKAMGIVFAAELAIKLLLDDVIMPLLNRTELEAAKQGAEMNEWYYVAKQLPSFIVGFAVIYFTLRLLIKPLNLHFSFHKTAFFITLLICVAVSTLEIYGLLQLTNALKVSNDLTSVTIQAFNMSMNVFDAAINVAGGIIFVLLDSTIFALVNWCVKQNSMKSAPAENYPPIDDK